MKTFARGVVLVAVLLFVLPAVATAITPIDGGSVSETPPTVINNSPGDQNDPHVSGDLVTYTDGIFPAIIRYYRFSTGVDTPVGSSVSTATWIWAPGITGSTPSAELAQFFFSKSISLTGAATAATISVAADNFAEVRVNGTVVGTTGSTTDASLAFAFTSHKAFDILPYLTVGANTITIRAQNGIDALAGCTNCTYQQNPAGVMFGGRISTEGSPATFGSDTSWEVFSVDPASAGATPLGFAQNVCLNVSSPVGCPLGATLYGYPGGAAWAANFRLTLGTGLTDILSDVSGDRIVFSRLTADRTAIMVFDTTSSSLIEIAPQAGVNRLGSAIGGDTVAFIDYSTGGSGDVFVANVNAPSTAQLLSGSPSLEQNPNVSPDGNVVVWELCPILLANCDVMKSVRTGTTWSPAEAVANSGSPEGNPDTDGTDIVYDADVPGSATGKDVYLVPVSGGSPVQLAIPGSQINPSISQGVIAFGSTSTISSDIFIYVIATNTMFRVTDTPTVNEWLNNISVLPNGDVRVVWAANDGPAGEQNVYARTFRVPLGTPAQMIADLIDETLLFLDRMPLAEALRARLEQVASALVANNHALACGLLNLYIAAVNASRSGRLTAAEKATLVADARAIKAAIGCP